MFHFYTQKDSINYLITEGKRWHVCSCRCGSASGSGGDDGVGRSVTIKAVTITTGQKMDGL